MWGDMQKQKQKQKQNCEYIYAEEKLQYIKYILCERPEEMKQLYKIRV